MSRCLPDREEREGHYMCGNNTYNSMELWSDKDLEYGQLVGEIYETGLERWAAKRTILYSPKTLSSLEFSPSVSNTPNSGNCSQWNSQSPITLHSLTLHIQSSSKSHQLYLPVINQIQLLVTTSPTPSLVQTIILVHLGNCLPASLPASLLTPQWPTFLQKPTLSLWKLLS